MANEEKKENGKCETSLDQIIVYEPGVEENGQKRFDNYRIQDSKGNPVGYVFGEFVEKVEKQLVAKKDDPFYQVSSTIANRIVKDRTVGSMIALGLYSVLTSIGGDKK